SDDSDEDLNVSIRSQLPPGIKNLITPRGARRLQQELELLLEKKRELSESGTPSSDTDAQLRKTQSRIRQLQQIVESLVVTPPSSGSQERVCFGASVVVRHANDQETIYRIVGINEIDLEQN